MRAGNDIKSNGDGVMSDFIPSPALIMLPPARITPSPLLFISFPARITPSPALIIVYSMLIMPFPDLIKDYSTLIIRFPGQKRDREKRSGHFFSAISPYGVKLAYRVSWRANYDVYGIGRGERAGGFE